MFDDDLEGIAPPSVAVTLVLIARVGGVPRYRYVGNGTQELAFQPWSSTKFMAAANAAARLRIASGNAVGLPARADDVALGDLVTIMTSYDETLGYTSNGIGKYFHDIGGRARANDLVHGAWLGRPASETSSSSGSRSIARSRGSASPGSSRPTSRRSSTVRDRMLARTYRTILPAIVDGRIP